MTAPIDPAFVVLGRRDGIRAVLLDAGGAEISRATIETDEFAAWVARAEAQWSPRWVWHDTPAWYDALLAAGVRVARAHDLRLVHALLRDAQSVGDDAGLRAAVEWDVASVAADTPPALFELAAERSAPGDEHAALAEFARQQRALAFSADPRRLRLLAAAESAGALVASEMRAAGLPWDPEVHHRILGDALGTRMPGAPPTRMQERAAEVRRLLGDPAASLDSQPKLLRSLRRAGLEVESTSRWELRRHDHPVVEPLIDYKQMMRLYTANGWAWLDEWVRDGRFRPIYVPAGVVTGRWASSGGGALQIPRQLRSAVRADPGWTFVVADVAQLEPRVLAAMARDLRLADAARGRDLYAGIVDDGAVGSRQEAKVAMLGAMYGATTGESGRLLPRLRRAYPRAMDLVDAAARTGESGGVVSTWLGRTSPAPSSTWQDSQSRASESAASGSDETSARRSARDRGRFTRNFVVQGTAAEWALAWLADLRGRLAAIPPVGSEEGAPRSGPVFARRPHLALFLHDEIIVHTPLSRAGEAAAAVQDAASAAGTLLFGSFPVDFRLDLRICEDAGKI